jgi:2-O-(6-phospho-alpha-D-mannosyl)-D-glycerate hydrolase
MQITEIMMETKAIEKTFFITHIHWDREWYWPIEKYRFRLIEVFEAMKKTLDRNDYHSFWFDGQMVFVEDYLEARPQDRDLIKRWVAEGKLHIGPFYVLNDEQLPCGEAQIRNYIVGMRLAAEFGPVAKVGYMADNFGHMSQTPQLLKGFGIDNALFGRGYKIDDDTEDLAIWRGADGSEVLGVLLSRHYSSCSGLVLDDDETFKHSLESIEFLKQHCSSGQLLLMYGIDHALPNPDTAKIVKKLTALSSLDAITHASFDEFFAAARKTDPTYRLNGELMFISGLDGTFSANIWQKALNRQAEKELILYAEPLAAMAEIITEREYPQQDFERAWKYLLRAHPHDSIPGCHADRVADDMRSRLLRSHDIASVIAENSFDAIQQQRLDYGDPTKYRVINLFNPSPYLRSEVVRTEIFLPKGESINKLWLKGADGILHKATILKDSPSSRPQRSDYMIPTRVPCQRLLVEFGPVELAPLSFSAFDIIHEALAEIGDILMGGIVGGAEHLSTTQNIQTAPGILENRYLKIVIHPDAKVDIQHKITGHWFTELHQFEAEQDAGSLYHFVPLLEQKIYYAQPGKMTLIKNSITSATVMVETVIEMPAGLLNTTVPKEKTVRNIIKVYYTLAAGEKFIRIRTEIDNQAENALIRTACRTNLHEAVNLTHTPFDIVSRPPLADPMTILEGRRDVSRYAASEFTSVSDGKNGLAILNNGLPEYCFYQHGQIDLTLLRGSRFIWGNDVYNFPTVEFKSDNGQCLGLNIAEYALLPFAESITIGSNLRAAFEYGTPPRCCLSMTPLNLQGIAVANPQIKMIAFKKSEDGNGYILRLLNLSTQPETTDITLPWGIIQVAKIRLDETAPQSLSCHDGKLNIKILSKELLTLRLLF